jgi:hypothetical protein
VTNIVNYEYCFGIASNRTVDSGRWTVGNVSVGAAVKLPPQQLWAVAEALSFKYFPLVVTVLAFFSIRGKAILQDCLPEFLVEN